MNQTICILGLGYIGLPTGVIFAKQGFSVIGVDINPEVIEHLTEGKVHFDEQGLEQSLIEVKADGAFRAQRMPDFADVYIVAVPTPITHAQTADLSFVISAIQSIIPYLKKATLLSLNPPFPQELQPISLPRC